METCLEILPDVVHDLSGHVVPNKSGYLVVVVGSGFLAFCGVQQGRSDVVE